MPFVRFDCDMCHQTGGSEPTPASSPLSPQLFSYEPSLVSCDPDTTTESLAGGLEGVVTPETGHLVVQQQHQPHIRQEAPQSLPLSSLTTILPPSAAAPMTGTCRVPLRPLDRGLSCLQGHVCPASFFSASWSSPSIPPSLTTHAATSLSTSPPLPQPQEIPLPSLPPLSPLYQLYLFSPAPSSSPNQQPCPTDPLLFHLEKLPHITTFPPSPFHSLSSLISFRPPRVPSAPLRRYSDQRDMRGMTEMTNPSPLSSSLPDQSTHLFLKPIKTTALPYSFHALSGAAAESAEETHITPSTPRSHSASSSFSASFLQLPHPLPPPQTLHQSQPSVQFQPHHHHQQQQEQTQQQHIGQQTLQPSSPSFSFEHGDQLQLCHSLGFCDLGKGMAGDEQPHSPAGSVTSHAASTEVWGSTDSLWDGSSCSTEPSTPMLPHSPAANLDPTEHLSHLEGAGAGGPEAGLPRFSSSLEALRLHEHQGVGQGEGYALAHSLSMQSLGRGGEACGTAGGGGESLQDGGEKEKGRGAASLEADWVESPLSVRAWLLS